MKYRQAFLSFCFPHLFKQMLWSFNIQGLQIRHKVIISPCNRTKWEREREKCGANMGTLVFAKGSKQEKSHSIYKSHAGRFWTEVHRDGRQRGQTLYRPSCFFVPTIILPASSTQQLNASSKKKKRKTIYYKNNPGNLMGEELVRWKKFP